MGTHVLLAYDGLEKAQTALELVAATPWPSGSRVTVVGVLDGTLPFYRVPEPSPVLAGEREREAIQEAARETAREALAAAAERLRSAGLEADWQLLEGDAARGILTALGAERPDLCVVGSRKPQTLDAALTPSFSQRLIEAATVPVLAARSDRLEPLVTRDGRELSSVIERLGLRRSADDGQGPSVGGTIVAHRREALRLFDRTDASVLAIPDDGRA